MKLLVGISDTRVGVQASTCDSLPSYWAYPEDVGTIHVRLLYYEVSRRGLNVSTWLMGRVIACILFSIHAATAKQPRRTILHHRSPAS